METTATTNLRQYADPRVSAAVVVAVVAVSEILLLSVSLPPEGSNNTHVLRVLYPAICSSSSDIQPPMYGRTDGLLLRLLLLLLLFANVTPTTMAAVNVHYVSTCACVRVCCYWFWCCLSERGDKSKRSDMCREMCCVQMLLHGIPTLPYTIEPPSNYNVMQC